MKSFVKWIKKKNNILYKDDTGYITGYLNNDGYWWIEEFVIFPKFRGKGLARNLASHIPKKSKLLAYPLVNMGGHQLSQENLKKFYISLGFVEISDEHGNVILKRD